MDISIAKAEVSVTKMVAEVVRRSVIEIAVGKMCSVRILRGFIFRGTVIMLFVKDEVNSTEWAWQLILIPLSFGDAPTPRKRLVDKIWVVSYIALSGVREWCIVFRRSSN